MFSAKSLRAQLRLRGSEQRRASTRPTNTSSLKRQNRESRKAWNPENLRDRNKNRRESIDNALAPEFRAVDDRFFRNRGTVVARNPESGKARNPESNSTPRQPFNQCNSAYRPEFTPWRSRNRGTRKAR